MNDLIKNLIEQLRATSGGTKLIALMGGASFLAIIALVAVVSKKSDLNATLFMNLTSSEATKVATALNAEGIEFLVSTSSPYFINVDEGDRTRAQAVAFASNALASSPAGIQTASGMGSVFSSADQRGQVVDKLNEEEIELMLVALSFVERASVRIHKPAKSAINNRDMKPMSIGVVVGVTGIPTPEQERSLAALVANSTGAASENITITDDNGNSLFDTSARSDQQGINKELLNYSFDWDEKTTQRANQWLSQNYGPDMISVMVKSEWDFDQSVERVESSPASVVTMQTDNETSRAARGQGGGIPGIGSTAGELKADPETTKQSSITSRPLIKRTDKVINQPRIKQLNVALTLHSSLADDKENIEQAVMGLVGFDKLRKDSMSTVVRDLYTLPLDEEAAVEETEPTSAPNPMLETLLRRGVEVLTASIFILVLMKSLKSAGKGQAAKVAGAKAQAEAEMDVELLARASVDELLKSDPERVGEVLSSWARGEQTVGSK